MNLAYLDWRGERRYAAGSPGGCRCAGNCLRQAVAAEPPGCDLRFERVMKGSLAAIRYCSDPQEGSPALPGSGGDPGSAILRRPDQVSCPDAESAWPASRRAFTASRSIVHLHELGGDDTLADIVGVWPAWKN
jgi:hypothetical protein